MIVTHRKPTRFARDKLKDPSGSQSNESSQLPSDKTLPRAGEIDRAAMKRKDPIFRLKNHLLIYLDCLCLIRKRQVRGEVQIGMALLPNPEKATKVPLEILYKGLGAE